MGEGHRLSRLRRIGLRSAIAALVLCLAPGMAPAQALGADGFRELTLDVTRLDGGPFTVSIGTILVTIQTEEPAPVNVVIFNLGRGEAGPDTLFTFTDPERLADIMSTCVTLYSECTVTAPKGASPRRIDMSYRLSPDLVAYEVRLAIGDDDVRITASAADPALARANLAEAQAQLFDNLGIVPSP